ncbi:hypothetical protein [Nocardiopsis nanhaiensis]
MSYPPPKPSAHGFQPSGSPRPGPGPNTAAPYHTAPRQGATPSPAAALPTRSQTVFRAVGAALAATATGHMLGWFATGLVSVLDSVYVYTVGMVLLPFALTPVLFGLFGRWFGVPSPTAAAAWGTPLYLVLPLLALFEVGTQPSPTDIMYSVLVDGYGLMPALFSLVAFVLFYPVVALLLRGRTGRRVRAARPEEHGVRADSPSAVPALHGSVDRSDIIRRAIGAAAVTVCAAQFFSWLSTLMLVSFPDSFLQETAFSLLPFLLTPILFGLFARLFRVPSARGATWLGVLFYILVVVSFLLGVFSSIFAALLPLTNFGAVPRFGDVLFSLGPLFPNLLVSLATFVPIALAVGVSSSKGTV